MTNQSTTSKTAQDTESNDSGSIADQTIAEFLGALCSKAPTPGGGAVAGLTLATAASTAGMVLHYTLGKKKYAQHESSNALTLNALVEARQFFLDAADKDASGYSELNALWSLAKDDPERVARWDSAVQGAIAPPISMLDQSIVIMRTISKLIHTTNTQLRSDLAVSAIMCKAGARAAACNIRVNAPLLPSDQQQPVLDHTQTVLDEIDRLSDHTQRECR
ncbi:MAG: cyclodeaminase/cyclohydrolase family protein [Phycisphaerales bacterium]